MSQPVEFEFGVKIDPSIEKALKQLEKMRAAEKAFATEVLKSGKVTDKAAKEMRRRNSEIKKQELALDKTGAAWRDLASDTDQAAKAQQRLQTEVEETNDAFDRASRSTALAGDVQSNIGATRGLLQAGGLEGLAGGLDIGGELIVLAEELPRLKTSLKGLPAAAASAADVLGLGGLTSSLQVVAPGLSATAAGALALAIPLAAVAAVFAGISIAAGELNRRVEEAKQAEENRNAVLLEGVATQREVQRLLQEGHHEQLVAARNAAFEQKAIAALSFQGLQDRRAELERQFNEATSNLNPFDEQNELAGLLETNQTALDGLISELTTTDERLRQFDEAISQLSESELNAAIHAEDLAAANEKAAKAEQTRVATLQKLTALEQQATSALENFSRRRTQQAEDTALEREFNLEDEQAQLQDHFSKLADIRQSGNDKLADIERQLTDLPAGRNQEILNATSKANASLAKLNQDYFNKQITSLDKFRLGEQRVNERYNKTLRRTLDSLRDSLSDAESSNDVNAFLAAQREGQKRLKELSEDQNDDTRQRLEDFSSQRAAEQQAHVEKLAEIHSALAQEKAAITETFNAKRTELAASLDLEKLALQDRLQGERDRYVEQERREDQQEERAARRLEIRTRREDEALQRQLDGINIKTQAELAAVLQVTSAMANLAASVSRAAAGGGITSSRSARSFGRGDPISRAASPFRRSRGLPVENAAGGFNSRRKTTLNFNPNVVVGDIATGRDVSEALRINTENIMSAIVGGMGGRIR